LPVLAQLWIIILRCIFGLLHILASIIFTPTYEIINLTYYSSYHFYNIYSVLKLVNCRNHKVVKATNMKGVFWILGSKNLCRQKCMSRSVLDIKIFWTKKFKIRPKMWLKSARLYNKTEYKGNIQNLSNSTISSSLIESVCWLCDKNI